MKLVLDYLLIGYTGGIQSRFLAGAAAAGGLGGNVPGRGRDAGVSLLAAGSYLSFFLFIDWSQWDIGPPEIAQLALRMVFLAMVGNLANALAEELRTQSEKYRRTAEQLEEAGVHIQRAEEAVRRSDRLAALGQLSAASPTSCAIRSAPSRRRRKC